MPSFELLSTPVSMSRIAVVTPRSSLRDALASVAELATVELSGPLPAAAGAELEALRRVERAHPGRVDEPPSLCARAVDLRELERTGSRGLLAGEAELAQRAAMSRKRGPFAVLVGWTPGHDVEALERRMETVGGGVIELPHPPWTDPPTLFTPTRVRRSFRPLVTTYGVAPYADVDPTPFAAISFVVMFAIMFGDVGHGLVLAALGLFLRRSSSRRIRPYRPLWPFLFAAGACSAVAGFAYGEAFGPTGLVPTLWRSPVDSPGPLLAFAIVVGLALLAVSHLYGIVNRWRESGPMLAILSPTGMAGLGALLGASLAALGLYTDQRTETGTGVAVFALGGAMMAAGFVLSAGGGVGLIQAGVELVDSLIRIISNLLSFTRLAAFGLMHAALSAVVFAAASALWGGPVGALLAAAVFLVGNIAAFSLELLVTGIQALRLEFYELFSRVFAGEGHAFKPWSLPVIDKEDQ